MKIQLVLIAAVAVYLSTIETVEAATSDLVPSLSSTLGLEPSDVGHQQEEAFLESDEGLVRNKRQFGYGGYGGYGGGYRRGFRGGYGYRGGYGGYRSYGGYGGGFGYGR